MLLKQSATIIACNDFIFSVYVAFSELRIYFSSGTSFDSALEYDLDWLSGYSQMSIAVILSDPLGSVSGSGDMIKSSICSTGRWQVS